MATQLPAPVQVPEDRPRRKDSRVLVVVGVLAPLVVAALLAVWLYPRFVGQDTTGLEGTWRMGNNGKHIHEFRRNGEVACWFGSSKEWWNQLGWSATWKRDGRRITIRTDRNWDFKGELDGDTIRGKMLMKGPNGVVDQEIDTVWQKE
jgi:hypothetical protein